MFDKKLKIVCIRLIYNLTSKLGTMEDMDNTEVYVFLGLQHNTHFYVHIVHSPMFDPVISHQIYNVLIHEKQIVCPKNNVIIYEICVETNTCDIVMISHIDNPSNPSILKNNLEEFFPVLIGAKRNDLSTIKYDYAKKAYLSFYVDNVDFAKYLDIPHTHIHINNLHKVVTRKPIPSN